MFLISILFLAGILAGVISGLLGIGGGIIFMPLLIFYYENAGYNPSEAAIAAIANAHFLTFFSGLIASYRQLKLKNFHLRFVLLLGLTGTIASVSVSHFVVSQPWFDRKVFSILFSLMVIPLIIDTFFRQKWVSKKSITIQKPIKVQNRLPWLGFISGSVAATTGLGGGNVMVPFMLTWLKFPVKIAVSVSQGCIVLMSGGIALYYLTKQSQSELSIPIVNLQDIFPLLLGILVASGFGVSLSQRLPEKKVKIAFIILFLIAIIRLNYKYIL